MDIRREKQIIAAIAKEFQNQICLKLKQELGGSIKRRGVYTVWSGINRANRALDIINAVLQEEIDATRKKNR